MAISLGVAAVGAGMSYFQGKKLEKDAKNKIEAYKRQDLTNVQEGRSVSTLGADLMTERADVANAGAISSLEKTGTRAIIGGLSATVENTNNVTREVATNLDMQQKEIDAAVAADNARIQGVVEDRQNAELSGYSNAMNVGMGMKYQGINQLFNATSAAGAMNGARIAEAGGAAATGTPDGRNKWGKILIGS